MEETTVID